MAVARSYDTVVIGGGVIGWSVAWWLKHRSPTMSIGVVERDPTLRIASTVLSAGSIRQQFSLVENIDISLFGAQFIKDIDSYLGVPGSVDGPVGVDFVEGGYLFLGSEKSLPILRDNFALQQERGADNVMLSADELAARFPWMNVDGVAAGTLGLSNEGWFDPWSLQRAFKDAAQREGCELVRGEVRSGRRDPEDGQLHSITTGDGETVRCGAVVNAAGAWASELIGALGVGRAEDYPVRRRKRLIFALDCPTGPTEDCPLVVDPSGVYFRREGEGGGSTFITGKSPDEEDDPDCTDDALDAVTADDHAFFEEQIWPVIAERVPAFEAIKVKSSWAGFYDYNTFDHNAIVGAHPECSNLFLANGFSGHGLQQVRHHTSTNVLSLFVRFSSAFRPLFVLTSGAWLVGPAGGGGAMQLQNAKPE